MSVHATPMDSIDSSGTALPPERLELYPSFGRLQPTRREWHVAIEGRVITPRPDNLRRKMLLRVIRRVLNASDAQLASPEFQERIQGFLMLTLGGRRVRCDFGGQPWMLAKKSKRSGMLRGTLHLPAASLEVPEGLPHSPWRSYQATSLKTSVAAAGKVQLVTPQGPSVISDIDDTIKSSHVSDRRQLLEHTFFHPFQDVPGMATLYQQWERAGVVFHYVSSSPWQLFNPLAGFLEQAGFPGGSYHLRSIRLRDPSILQLVVGRKRSKKRALRSILKAFPDRHFVLIGDAGERDPEIYGSTARKFPRQVAHICIRRLPGAPEGPDRYRRAFRDLPASAWRLFDDPAELADLVPRAGGRWTS